MDTQAFTQAPTKAPATLAGHAGREAASAKPDDEWTVDDVVRSIRKVDRAPHHARRWAAAFGVIVFAAATVRPSACRPMVRQPRRSHRAAVANRGGCRGTRHVKVRRVAGARGALVARRCRRRPSARCSHGRNVIVVMPADRDYLSATSIPVAGIALGRPHGPRIRSVHVALYVGGRLVEGTDLEVYAGRFAGVLGLHDRDRPGRSPSSGSATRPTRRRLP